MLSYIIVSVIPTCKLTVDLFTRNVPGRTVRLMGGAMAVVVLVLAIQEYSPLSV